MAPIPTRPLGRTGHAATLFGLGGEGVLRTHGRMKEAVAVIERALDLGVNYCDTAPAYAQSLDYYGEALGPRRDQVFLASKTHDRTRDGSLRLLDDSLRRLRTSWLDLWQLHDLRTTDDLDRIFGRGGALEALVQARDQKRVRYLGITGHHDPAIPGRGRGKCPDRAALSPAGRQAAAGAGGADQTRGGGLDLLQARLATLRSAPRQRRHPG